MPKPCTCEVSECTLPHVVQSLASRRSLVYNAYDALAVAAFLRASGRTPTYKLAWTDTAITEQWTVA